MPIKNLKIIILLCWIPLFQSCHIFNHYVLKMNRDLKFESKDDYGRYLKSFYKIDQQNIYYISEKSYFTFLTTSANKSMGHYYGIFINDRLKLVNSSYLEEQKSCYGRIQSEISNLPNSTTVLDSLFLKNEILPISNIEQAAFKPKENMNTIVLVISVRQGRVYKNDFKNIQDKFKDNGDYQLVILTLDPIYDLK